MDLRGLGPLSPNVDPTDQLKSVLDAFGKAGTPPGGTTPAEDTVAALLPGGGLCVVSQSEAGGGAHADPDEPALSGEVSGEHADQQHGAIR